MVYLCCHVVSVLSVLPCCVCAICAAVLYLLNEHCVLFSICSVFSTHKLPVERTLHIYNAKGNYSQGVRAELSSEATNSRRSLALACYVP